MTLFELFLGIFAFTIVWSLYAGFEAYATHKALERRQAKCTHTQYIHLPLENHEGKVVARECQHCKLRFPVQPTEAEL